MQNKPANCQIQMPKINKYSTVLKIITIFLTKPFLATIDGRVFIKKWSATNGEWM